MTPDQQIIAAALHLGARWRKSKHDTYYLTFVPDKVSTFTYGGRPVNPIPPDRPAEFAHYIASDIPNYHKSLDAVARLEISLIQAHKLDVYSNKLQLVCSQRYEAFNHMEWTDQIDSLIVAEPDIRLIACLRTLNLWTST